MLKYCKPFLVVISQNLVLTMITIISPVFFIFNSKSWHGFAFCQSFILSFLLSAFPLRFQSGENPSHGIMEIFNSGSWQKLCTRSWGTDEENLTCQAMGYSSSGVYNSTWYGGNSNVPNTSIIYNCTALTKCGNDTDNKRQLCKGSLHITCHGPASCTPLCIPSLHFLVFDNAYYWIFLWL